MGWVVCVIQHKHISKIIYIEKMKRSIDHIDHAFMPPAKRQRVLNEYINNIRVVELRENIFKKEYDNILKGYRRTYVENAHICDRLSHMDVHHHSIS